MVEADRRRTWFREQVLPVEPMLRDYAVRFCRNGPEEPDDLVHEALVQLIRYANWENVRNVEAFALTVLKNVALQAFRRRRVTPIDSAADLDMLGVADDEPAADRVAEARDELRLVSRLIAELPQQCRRVFILRKIEGLSNIEIADRLGLSISTVEKHAIKGLRLVSSRLTAATGTVRYRGASGSRREGAARAGT